MKPKLTLLAALVAGLLAILPSSIFAAANVRDYGAVGDGNADDTAEIDAAIAASNAVYFPPGRYKYTNPNRMNLPGTKSYRLYGDGAGNSIIEFWGNPYNGILMSSTQANPRTLTVEGLTLKAMTAGCGDAINAQFGDLSADGAWKTRCLTVRNVQIQGTDRTGSPTGYWNHGMYLWQAMNSVIEDVQFENKFQYGTGIYWGSSPSYGTTQLFVNNVSLLYWAKAVKTDGHVEGFYMSNFELVGVGTYYSYAMELEASGVSYSPVFHLTNGHLSFLGGGVRFHNLNSVKVANVNFAHVGFAVGGGQGSGTHLYLDNVTNASVTGSEFAGVPGIHYENGVYIGTGSEDVRVSGCLFSMAPAYGGSALVALSGVSRTRWLDNNFKGTINRYDNYSGSATFIRDIP
ncbi:MAG TPA: glycosyl hydrolase family 28-related protein [Chthoniobacterales bacterium]|nr:glycosyl hydrolase family 28-related protein [Chthoniobacterales bacterium]